MEEKRKRTFQLNPKKVCSKSGLSSAIEWQKVYIYMCVWVGGWWVECLSDFDFINH